MVDRHQRVAALMDEQNLDAILFFGAGQFSTDVYWLTDWPLASVIVMVAWQWLPHFLAADKDLIKSVDKVLSAEFKGTAVEPLGRSRGDLPASA